MSCSQVNHFTQIPVSLGTMSVRPDSQNKIQWISDNLRYRLRVLAWAHAAQSRWCRNAFQLFKLCILPRRWGQLLLLRKIISLWPSILNPYSSVGMCISEKCPPNVPTWDQVFILKSDILLVCTQGACTSVQLDCCWLTSTVVKKETLIWRAVQGY